jgi:signal transduction histidine kinase
VESRPAYGAAKVAIIYVSISALYIYSSDRALRILVGQPDLLTTAQTYKGILFVLLSSLLIYILVRKSEKENVRLLGELDNKVKERTARLEEAMLLAESSNKAKSEFIANMSHELKTPLNAIIGFSEAMLGGIYGPINERHREYLNDILLSGEKLLALINDILDLTKIESGSVPLDLREFSLRELIKSTGGLFREKMLSHNIKIDYKIDEGLDEVVADQKKIKQVMINLLSNAIKFSPDGGKISVCARKLQDLFEISVLDTGIGVEEEDIPKLFQPFTQLESSLHKRFGGAGFGLFLAKRLIELQGGDIRAESRKGEGTSFTFSIPIRGDL